MPMSRLRRAAVVAGLSTALGLAASCTTGSSDGATGGDDGGLTVSIYGTDGIMSPDFSHALTDPELVAGAKGTRPMPMLPAEFTNRVQEFDSSVQDFRFVGETYDAVVISAVAAELAGTTDPAVIRDYIIGVTAVGERCENPAACLELAREGTDVAYRGVSLTA